MHATPATASSSLTYRHPVRPSSTKSASPSGQCSRSQRRNVSRVAWRICPECTYPSSPTYSKVIWTPPGPSRPHEIEVRLAYEVS